MTEPNIVTCLKNDPKFSKLLSSLLQKNGHLSYITEQYLIRAIYSNVIEDGESFDKQTKNRNETGSNLSLRTRLTVLSKRLGRKRCCDAIPDRCLGGVSSHYLRFAL